MTKTATIFGRLKLSFMIPPPPFPPSSNKCAMLSAVFLKLNKPFFSFYVAAVFLMDSAVYPMSEFELIFMPIIEYFQS